MLFIISKKGEPIVDDKEFPELEVDELTPEQKAEEEKKTEIEKFGIFADSTCAVDEAKRTVTITIDDPLPDKDRIEITTDEAKVCQLLAGSVGGFLKDLAGKVRFFDGK